jgi:hypothetical protein
MSAVRIVLSCALLAAWPALAEGQPVTNAAGVSAGAADSPKAGLQTTTAISTNVSTNAAASSRSEEIRSACIANRRCVCGRVLEVTPAGLVVESGYPMLLKPPFSHSWLTRGSAALVRPADLVEGTAPDSIAVGVVFLTDIPRRKTVHQYDYVALIGYPAGQYDYTPLPTVKKTIRRFAGGLERAVNLTLQSGGH